ncbi:MAG: amidohydrolase [Anaerolineae bacterium]|nr:amidohydrolase [Anaerolineae bacterium]
MKVHLLHNARIFTGLSEHPWAHALAIVNGRIVDLDHAALAWQTAPEVVSEDMDGALIIPGLTDAHIHLMWYANGLRELDLRDLTREQTLNRVAERAARSDLGTWITGRGWDQNIWQDNSFPTAKELDRATTKHPVALNAKSGHALITNSLAMQIAGITAATPDPVHGRIDRDERGRPTGVFLEDAMGLISRAKPKPEMAALADLMDEAQDNLLARGIVGVHDVDGHPAFASMQTLQRQDRLRIRIVKYARLDALDAILGADLRSGYGDDHLRFGGLKLFADGALGARTAAMFEPYEEEPENVGILTMEPEQLEEIAQRAAANGLALAIHAIGDRTNQLVLNVLESVIPIDPSLRHRIEHVQLITEEDQQRLGRSGIVASMQPTHAIHDIRMADRYWGDRSAQAYAWRSIADAGATLAFGSDCPIEIFDPFLGLYAAVSRRSETDGYPGPDGWYSTQRLTLTEALQAYTYGAAYAAGLERSLGLLSPGYHADLAVLSHDIFELPPQALLETRVLRTMVGGVWHYVG